LSPLIRGYRVPAQLGTGPHQPHPCRARRDPEHCRLLRAQAGEVHKLDQRAIPVRQRAQPADQVAPRPFRVDAVEQFFDLIRFAARTRPPRRSRPPAWLLQFSRSRL
jgi:hypothetical protein